MLSVLAPTRFVLVALLTGPLLAGCGEPELVPAPDLGQTRPPLPAYDVTSERPAARAALTLVPAVATEVTVTDFDESRAQVGLPDLTSESLVTDRTAYWERARTETVLLSEGRLRDQDSRLLLDFGFSSDDVDWEASWTGPDGSGWVVAFRPDLDMDRVAAAVGAKVGPLRGATVDPDRQLVSHGLPEDGARTWGDREEIRDIAGDVPAESAYYRSSCVPLADALGPDATVEDQEAVLAEHAVERFDDLDAFGVSFVDGQATARIGLDRTDVLDRADLADDFPAIGPVGWHDAFDRGVNDPSTGRLGWDVTTPVLAAGLVLTDVLPFAVCPDVTPRDEPTGL